jgi:hypothetical protein
VLPREHLRAWPIIRDAVIIYAITFVGAFIVVLPGVAQLSPTASNLVAGLCNLAFGGVGFAFSGCRAPRGNRWAHLGWVAVLIWLSGLVEAIISKDWLISWLLSVVPIGISMGLGGLISMLVMRQRDE